MIGVCKRERESEENSCKFANFSQVTSEGMGDPLVKVLVWVEVRGLFRVFSTYVQHGQPTRLAHSYWRNHFVVASHCKLQV